MPRGRSSCLAASSSSVANTPSRALLSMIPTSIALTRSATAGHDPGVCCRYHSAVALWLLGCPDQAVAMAHDAVRLATELAQPFSLAIALGYLSFLHQFRGEARLAQEQAEATIALSTEQGFPQYRATGIIIRGWAVAAQGDLEAGTAALQEGLADLRAAGADVRRSYFLALLADICARAGRTEAAQSAIAEALAFAEESGERWWEADLLPAQRRAAARPIGGEPRRGRSLLPSGAGGRAQAECARRSSCAPRPASPVCGPSRAGAPRPTTCSRQSTAGSPRASTPPTSRTPRRCSRSCGEPGGRRSRVARGERLRSLRRYLRRKRDRWRSAA